jgi:hypothetical protein
MVGIGAPALLIFLFGLLTNWQKPTEFVDRITG